MKPEKNVGNASNLKKWLEEEFVVGVNRKTIFVFLITAIIVPAIVSSSVSWFMIQTQLQNEQRNIANGYLSDLDFVERSLTVQWNEYMASPDADNPIQWVNPVYPPWGLYYSNRQDISKLDPDLAKQTYQVYYLLLITEDARNTNNNFDKLYYTDFNNNASVQNRIISRSSAFNSMMTGINTSIHVIPYLKANLAKVANPHTEQELLLW
jgi:hypothetical protein